MAILLNLVKSSGRVAPITAYVLIRLGVSLTQCCSGSDTRAYAYAIC